MNQIITLGREFGSGGREVGKRLAELLGYAYYDKEIVAEISKRTQLAESYVRQIVEKKPHIFYPITTGHSMHDESPDYLLRQYNTIYAEQAKVITEMAEKSPCVIVGRCADYILKDMKPLRLFIYADDDTKLVRCRNTADLNENIPDNKMRRKIKKINKNRARYYNYYTGRNWGDRTNYDICVNTSLITPKEAAELLAGLIKGRETAEQ